MSSIYNCPCCGEKTFNPLTKAMAGTMRSKGRVCPKCGKRCVNGKGATIFAAIYFLISFIFVVYVFMHGKDSVWWDTHEVPIVMALILNMYIVPKIVNGFCFKMMETLRIDAYEK
ncbi:MAG: hypothetical protein K6G33_00755 [Ruminococcus sp.]|uniref:hypothetical protein n=1 Tax=Ruminococcus sp. TaxID=41978 RepID=UPI0025DD0DAA|nr:hypothetical protein [Ruminococcus sp.]MCR5599263.1 hypothetical protein [Ruminococcus sp.]